MIGTHDTYDLDDALSRIDFATVHGWLKDTYWSPGISRARVELGARHSSLVVGAYAAGGSEVGFLRVVSDRTRFAYIADVYVAEPARKRGLAKAMVRFAMEHPDHRHIDKWLLATRDAHEVYKALGFVDLPNPKNYLVLKPGQGL